MAIAFRAASNYERPDDNDWTMYTPKPTGVVDDDVMLAIVTMARGNRIYSVDSGWHKIDDWTASSGVKCYAYYKVAGPYESSYYNFEMNEMSSVGAVSIIAFSGVDNSSPIRDSNTASASNALSLMSPALSGTQSTDMVVILAGARPENSHSTNVVSGPTGSSWTSPSNALAGPSGSGYPASSDASYKINGTTELFTTDYSSGIGAIAISLISNIVTPPTQTHALTGTITAKTISSATLFNLTRPPAPPTYQFFIDWNRDNGLRISDFETDFDGWIPEGMLEVSNDYSFSGNGALKVVWEAIVAGSNPTNSFKFNNGTYGFDSGTFGFDGTDPVDDPTVTVTYGFNGLVIGSPYTLSVWLYVPYLSGQHVTVGVTDLIESTVTDSNDLDLWVERRVDFIASSTSHELFVRANGTVTDGNITYMDYVFLEGEFENITTRVRGTESISWDYGRDQSRALNPISPAETELSLDNQDLFLSPNNTGSPLNKYLLPNRELLIRAHYDNRYIDLFRGYIDDIDIDPYITEQTVNFSAIDPLASVASGQLSTQMWRGLRTGDAIDKILDEIGWPTNKRDIDPGASVISHFWVEAQDASDAISDVVASEGPPAFATVSDAGYFIFRDRHHRIVNPRSTVVQATFNAGGIEPCFSPPMDFNIGWKDIINSVSLQVNERILGAFENDGTGEAPVVWKLEDTISIPGGYSREFKVTSETPTLFFQIPNAKKNDYIVAGGSVQFALDRISGQSCTLTVTAPDNDIALTGLAVRGYPIDTADGILINVNDESSQADVGIKADPNNIEAPWANANDALAIGQIVTRQRGKRLPTISIDVNSGTPERTREIFTRQLSDLVHVIEPRSYTHNDFYIESIGHEISIAGKLHKVTYGLEAVPTVVEDVDAENAAPAFTFNDVDAGFDAGAFAYDTISADPDDIMILDVSALDEDGLGY